MSVSTHWHKSDGGFSQMPFLSEMKHKYCKLRKYLALLQKHFLDFPICIFSHIDGAQASKDVITFKTTTTTTITKKKVSFV